MTDNCVRGSRLFGAYKVFTASQNLANHNHDHYITQLWEVTACQFTRAAPKFVASPVYASTPFLISLILFFPTAATSIQHYRHSPLAASPQIWAKELKPPITSTRVNLKAVSNLFSSQNIPQWYFSQNPATDNFFNLYMQCIWTTWSLRNMYEREFGLHHADYGFAFSTTQVHRMIALIICIIFVVGKYQQSGNVFNLCNIHFLQFFYLPAPFCWKATVGSPRYTWRVLW